MTDIVEHLKECAKYADEYQSDVDAFKAAAAEITRLREENKRLRAALKALALKAPVQLTCDGGGSIQAIIVRESELNAAREALGNSNEKTGI